MPPKKQSVEERIEAGIKADIPNIYFNGFTNTVGSGDVLIVLESNGKPVATLNTSFTVAKTLVAKLNATLQHLETATKNKIMTTDDVQGALSSKNN